MGQFLGYQSYDRHTYCRACGEEWPTEDVDHHHSCPVKDYKDEDDDEEDEDDEEEEEEEE